jgi:serine O-acetyltransferase
MTIKFQEQLEKIVSEIAKSYKKQPYAAFQDIGPLPNKDIVIEIANLLMQILYPGYFGKQTLIHGAVEYHIGDLLIIIYEKLYDQISFALKHQLNSSDKFDAFDIEEKVEKTAFSFLGQIPKIRKYLSTDVQAAFDGDPAAEDRDEIIFSYPGIFAVSIYRIAHELYKLSVPLIPRILSEHAHSKTGIDIHSGAKIGKHFFIDHGTGVVIGETCVIGEKVKIYQGVTLGALSTKGGQALRGIKRHPTLENEVTVYSGATILGGETVIGKGVVIGGNAFITKSVPAGTKVSIKNPELLYKNKAPEEFKQGFDDWVI